MQAGMQPTAAAGKQCGSEGLCRWLLWGSSVCGCSCARLCMPKATALQYCGSIFASSSYRPSLRISEGPMSKSVAWQHCCGVVTVEAINSPVLLPDSDALGSSCNGSLCGLIPTVPPPATALNIQTLQDCQTIYPACWHQNCPIIGTTVYIIFLAAQIKDAKVCMCLLQTQHNYVMLACCDWGTR